MADNNCSETKITIVHFNDVYNIEQRVQEPVGGASRFTTAVRRLAAASLNPLVLFSGDAFNPSLMSTVTGGRQMVPVLNAIGVGCALYGNHDFDYGVDNLVKLAKETTFPWLLSNVYDIMTGNPLAEGVVTHTMIWQGKKLGFIGLIEEDWIATLSTLNPEDLDYVDFVTEGRKLAKELKSQGVDYVIALTHMRWPNDIRLAENVEEIDLILGGHDHYYSARLINGRYVIKSGTDFRNYAKVTLSFAGDGKVGVEAEECIVDSSIPEDEEVMKVVIEYSKIMGAKMESVIGHIDVDLDGRFSSIRQQETNLGNFVSDIMLASLEADVALLNSGTLRSDCIHPKGEFRFKDLMAILPMVDPLVLIHATGEKIIAALENGVSKYPTLEGRFPQVSGISFGFDPRCPPGQRINVATVTIQGKPIEMQTVYRVVTKSYMAKGKDGYDVLATCPVLINEDDGPILSSIVQNHFQAVQIVSGEKQPMYHHRQSIISLSRRRILAREATITEVVEPSDQVDGGQAKMNNACRWRKAKMVLAFARQKSVYAVEQEEVQRACAPSVQHRIIVDV